MTRPRQPSRSAFCVAAVLACVAVMTAQAGPATAVSYKQLQQARQHYQQIQAELNRLAQNYSRQQQRASDLQDKVTGTGRSISKANAQLNQLREQLRLRVRTAYQLGGVGFFEFLLSSHSFRDFSLRAMLLERQASHDEDLMLQMRRLRADLSSRQRVLRSDQKAEQSVLAGLRRKAADLGSAFGVAQQLVTQLETETRAQDLALFFRTHTGEVASGMVIPLDRCPAAGPHAFSNDWHAPRPGGRLHQGNDVFAPMGSPAVAVVPGVVSRHSSGGLGGLGAYLWGDDGVEFYYAHLSGFATPVGVRVSARETIGYVGNTGDAAGGPTHIHFEIHPGGGAPINPYPSLIRVC